MVESSIIGYDNGHSVLFGLCAEGFTSKEMREINSRNPQHPLEKSSKSNQKQSAHTTQTEIVNSKLVRDTS